MKIPLPSTKAIWTFALATVALLAQLPSAHSEDTTSPATDQKPKKPAPLIVMPTRDPLPMVAAINQEWSRALATAKFEPSPDAADEEFLRRVCLDLIGHVPTYSQTTKFLKSTDPNKREQLIDELLASREFGKHFGQRWRHLIAPRNLGKTNEVADRLSPWLAEHFNANRPWSFIVRELLTTNSQLKYEGPAAFYRANSEDLKLKENQLAASVGRLFLGVQIGCAECHNHPFAEWKQDDFWGLAAVFTRTRKISNKDTSLTEEPNNGDFDPANDQPAIILPLSAGRGAGKVISARFLAAEQPIQTTQAALRPLLADWITAAENPYFSKAMVNRLWAHFFGRGLVNPVDDFREGNPASHPQLLDKLAVEFTASGYDVKHLVRCLCRSQAYQRTSEPTDSNASDTQWFSHQAVKVMTPEMLYDSLNVVLNGSVPVPPPKGVKKVIVKKERVALETREQFIRYFARASGSEDGDRFAYGIPQRLRLMNGSDLNTTPSFIVEQLAQGANAAKMIETLYLVVLSRPPAEKESQRMLELVGDRVSHAEVYTSVLWVLLNSGEFIVNR